MANNMMSIKSDEQVKRWEDKKVKRAS